MGSSFYTSKRVAARLYNFSDAPVQMEKNIEIFLAI
jgi:hypothetical protein